MERFEARPRGKNGAWVVFDTERQCAVMQSVSPRAEYNKEFAEKAAYLMNFGERTSLVFSK